MVVIGSGGSSSAGTVGRGGAIAGAAELTVFGLPSTVFDGNNTGEERRSRRTYYG